MWFSFNRVAELGWLNGSLYPYLADNLAVGDQTSRWFAGLFTGDKLGETSAPRGTDSLFTWIFGLLTNIFGSGWLAWGFLILFSLASVGLIRQWFKMSPQKRLWLGLLIAHLGLLLLFPVLRFLSVGHANINTIAGQHVIFPTGAIVVLLLVNGLSAWLTTSRLTALFCIMGGAGLWQSLVLISNLHTTPLPIQAVPLSKNEHIVTIFGDIALIDYEYKLNHQALLTTLYWRAENFLTEDFYIELTLLDDQKQPQARWLGQPLNGRYPTRAWIKGDRIRDTISLPVGGLPAGNYQLQLQLLNNAKQAVNHVPFSLSDVTLDTPPPPLILEDTISLNGVNMGYALWLQGQSLETLPLYEERATIVIVTSKQLFDNTRVSLVSSDGKAYEPVDHTGFTYNFFVEPRFARGQYRLRFERWLNDQLVARVETADLLQIRTAERQFEIGPIAHPLQANFAGQVVLLGYDLPQRRVKTGSELPVTLHWQALKAIGADLITFNRLINQDQQVFGEKDRQVRGVYSTLLWTPGEIVTDPFYLQIDPDAPNGIYYLVVGLYLPVGQSAVSLPLVEDGKFTNVTSVNIGPIKVGKTPSHLIVDAPSPQHRVEHILGEKPNLKIIGYDLSQSSLTLYWQLISPLSIDYTTFVHIRNEANEIIVQKDQPPVGGVYPTSLWDVGEVIADKIVISLPHNLPSGKYRVIVGMYDFQTGQRLNVSNSSVNEIELTTIQIP